MFECQFAARLRTTVLAAVSFLPFACIAATQPSPPATQPSPSATAFTPQDLVTLRRLTDPQVSRDGRTVAFVLSDTDLPANRRRTHLYLLDLKAAHAAPAQILPPADANDSNPRWSPDSRTLYFLSDRSGTSQVWRVSAAGGAPSQVTDYPLAVESMKVSPRGDHVALSMAVFPECTDLDCTRKRLDALHARKATGRVYDRIFIRHWDTWSDGTRSHLFVAALGNDGKASAPVDISRPLDGDVPSKPFGGDEEYNFSPDGSRVVFSLRVAGRTEPWSTNFDLFESPVAGGGEPRNLTAANPAWDTQPVFLANGDLAWLAQERPGFESDRFHVMLRSARGATREIARDWDVSVGHLAAAGDGRNLLASADHLGQTALFRIDVAKGTARPVFDKGQVNDFSAARDFVVAGLANLSAPVDLYLASTNGKPQPRRLTRVNQEKLATRALSPFEQFSFSGAEDAKVYGYVVKPFGFRDGMRYPIAFLVHGGPQTSMGNIWNYRWNAQAFAARGYGVVMIDFHGSPGYGQAFTDSISHDWGGKPLVDLQKGLAAAISQYGWLDGERACALGASYGGFMMNWIAGNWPDRFKCLVNHDGIFDQRMMYYSTEELWFPEWEHGGPYYDNPQGHERFNPALFVKQWKTPMLIIHSEQDFRIPYDEGIATFTALQRRGIESRFLTFPDENHWVLKPANSVQWHETVFDWLDAHLAPAR